MAEDISEIRNDYSMDSLTEGTIHPDPIFQFGRWMSDALRAGIDEPAAMTLATVLSAIISPQSQVIPDRLHDRLRYTRREDRWIIERLAP